MRGLLCKWKLGPEDGELIVARMVVVVAMEVE